MKSLWKNIPARDSSNYQRTDVVKWPHSRLFCLIAYNRLYLHFDVYPKTEKCLKNMLKY